MQIKVDLKILIFALIFFSNKSDKIIHITNDICIYTRNGTSNYWCMFRV